MAGTDSTATIATGTGALGAVGLAADDGMGYGDGAGAARTSACRVQALQASGQFIGAELHRVDLPQQGRAEIRKKPTGSEVAAGKLIADAASLLRPPMQQSFDYGCEFEVECRGPSMRE